MILTERGLLRTFGRFMPGRHCPQPLQVSSFVVTQGPCDAPMLAWLAVAALTQPPTAVSLTE